MIELYQTFLMKVCLGLLLAGGLWLLARWVLRGVGPVLRNWALALLAVGAVMYGGSKSITSRTTHDDDIPLASADHWAGESITNVPQSVREYYGLTTNSTAYVFGFTNSTALAGEGWLMDRGAFWRDSDHDQWSSVSSPNLPGTSVSITSWAGTGGTNYAAVLYGSTNVAVKAMYHVGSDLPAVVVDVEGGVTLDAFEMTSRRATVTYTVDAAALTGPGTVAFDRMDAGGEWQTVRTVEAVAGQHSEVFYGFMVGRRTMWRVRLLVEVSE